MGFFHKKFAIVKYSSYIYYIISTTLTTTTMTIPSKIIYWFCLTLLWAISILSFFRLARPVNRVSFLRLRVALRKNERFEAQAKLVDQSFKKAIKENLPLDQCMVEFKKLAEMPV
jgi:hypothetical protein